MSHSAINRVLNTGGEVKQTRRLVLFCLANYADDEGYSYPKKSTIKRVCNAGDTAVDQALAWLEAEGYIERIINGWAGVRGQIPEGRRPNLYRIHVSQEGEATGPKTTREAPRSPEGGSPECGDPGSPESGGGGSPESGDQNHHYEPPLENPPPTPSGGGGDGTGSQALFEDSPKGRRRKQVAEHRKQSSSMVVAAGESFWEDWPSGKGRGAKATFLDAWCKRLAAGVDRKGQPLTISDLITRRDNYRDARARYHRWWKDRGVEAHAPMLNGSTFVNSKSVLWVEPWEDDDIRYWPPPRGCSWDDEPVGHGAVVGRSMFDALDAEIAAERAARAAAKEAAG